MANIKINTPSINLDDLIKLSHLEVLDYLIKRSAEDVTNLDEFDIDEVANIISMHYKNLFTDDFLARYKKTVEDYKSMLDQA